MSHFFSVDSIYYYDVLSTHYTKTNNVSTYRLKFTFMYIQQQNCIVKMLFDNY